MKGNLPQSLVLSPQSSVLNMDPIAYYHDLLTDELAVESQAMLDDQLARRDLVFGGRPLCTVLRPRLLTGAQYHLLGERVRAIMRVFGRAYEAAIADPAFRGQFGLTDWEEILVARHPGFPDPSPTSRLDAFIVHETGEMGLTEYNAETPAGAAFNDALTDSFADLPIMRAFARRFEVRPLPARHGVFRVLLEAYGAWAGRRSPPRIAIVDWPDVPTYNEFVLFQRYFHSLGLDCVIVDPRAMDYRGGRLYAEGEPVDLIYKRVLISELIKECGLDGPVVRAVQDGAVCMVNPFRSKILHKKASLAVLSDERNAGYFGAEELETVRAYIPWTRRVEERTTVYQGRKVDLLPFIAEHRGRLVLKPNDDYGGAGIVLGWQVDGATWEREVRHALTAPFIVQERVAIPSEPYPSLVDGRLAVYDRMLDTAPFVCSSDYAEGCLARLSTAALLNVTAGGGSTVPVFVVEAR